jgi:hypothetical protein
MNQQESVVEEVHKEIIERFPLYVTNPGFEQWLFRKAGGDQGKIADYLGLLDSYGYMHGDGKLADDYVNLPDPQGVMEDIRRRLGGVGPEIRRALSYASVEGEKFCGSTITALGGADPAETKRLLQEAERGGLVTPDGTEAIYSGFCERYRFTPLQLRDVLYEELSEEERMRLHDAFVEFLSHELDRVDDGGAREMLQQMISLHNRRAARPSPSPTKP